MASLALRVSEPQFEIPDIETLPTCPKNVSESYLLTLPPIHLVVLEALRVVLPLNLKLPEVDLYHQ
jgi:hypothetical protein